MIDHSEALPQLTDWTFFRFAQCDVPIFENQLHQFSSLLRSALLKPPHSIFECHKQGKIPFVIPSEALQNRWKRGEEDAIVDEIMDCVRSRMKMNQQDTSFNDFVKEKLYSFIEVRINRLSSKDGVWEPDFSRNLADLYKEALGTSSKSIQHLLIKFGVPCEQSETKKTLKLQNSEPTTPIAAFRVLYEKPTPTKIQVCLQIREWRNLAFVCSALEDCRWLTAECYRQATKLSHVSFELEAVRLIASSMLDLVDQQLHESHFFDSQTSLVKAEQYISDYVPGGELREKENSIQLSNLIHEESLVKSKEEWLKLHSTAKLACGESGDLEEQLQYNREQLHRLRCSQIKIFTRGGHASKILLIKCMSQAYTIAIRFRNLIDQWASRLLQRTFCEANNLFIFQLGLGHSGSRGSLIKKLGKQLTTNGSGGIDQKLNQYFLETENGKSVLGLFESLQPYGEESNRQIPEWLPLLISITNKAKHVEERIASLEDIRNVSTSDEFLYFQVEDSLFEYYSFTEDAKKGNYLNRLASSTKLLKTLKGKDILCSKGRASERLLDQTRRSLTPLLLKDVPPCLVSEFEWEKVIDRIWRLRNYSMTQQKVPGALTLDKTSFIEFVLPNQIILEPEHASEKLFMSLSCSQQSHEADHPLKHPICVDVVACGCDTTLKNLRVQWRNLIKSGSSQPIGLGQVFNETNLQEFLRNKEKSHRQSKRVQCDLLPIPRRVLVRPFLQIVLDEVSRITST